MHDLAILAKHLQGQHPQQSHAGGSRSRIKLQIKDRERITNPENAAAYENYLRERHKSTSPTLTVGLYDRKTGDFHLSSSNTSHTSLTRSVTADHKEAARLEDSSFHVVFHIQDYKISQVSYDVAQAGKSMSRLGVGGIDKTEVVDSIYKNMNKLHRWGLPADTPTHIRTDEGEIETTLKGYFSLKQNRYADLLFTLTGSNHIGCRKRKISEEPMKTICIDFDGVLHYDVLPWKGASVIEGDPVPGAVAFVKEAKQKFDEVAVYSARSSEPGGIEAMQEWMRKYGFPEVSFPLFKPPAHVYLDDRGVVFGGKFPDIDYLYNYVPWHKRVANALKHLQGQHPQKSHGGAGKISTRSSGKRPTGPTKRRGGRRPGSSSVYKPGPMRKLPRKAPPPPPPPSPKEKPTGHRPPQKHELEALEIIEHLTLSGGSGSTPTSISPEAREFLKQTVTKKDYKLYRGMGLIRDRVSSKNQQILNDAEVGDPAPDFLAKKWNPYASYTTKKGVANIYAEGTVGVMIQAKVPAAKVLVDTSQLKRVIEENGIRQDIFDEDSYGYFKGEREVIVEEPIGQGGIIAKKTGRF